MQERVTATEFKDALISTNACICIGTHSQPLLQNRLMDVYKAW